MAERRRAATDVDDRVAMENAEATRLHEREQPYHIKYRPRVLGDVIGQRAAVESIAAAVKSPSRQHTYFLFGPGGTGKTTLARIMARMFGCGAVVEVDAASESGIDAMREVTKAARYQGFGDEPNRAYIIDEAQGLSKQAWDSLLRTTEQPPEHAFFFFCSTNPGKIPAPMLTRGPQYVLQPVRRDDLLDLIDYVCDQEGLNTPNAVRDVVAESCGGSPRQALVMLAQVEAAVDSEAAEDVLQHVGETKEVIDLCRALVKGSLDWPAVQRSLAPLEDLGAEGIRIQVTLYLTKVLMTSKSPRDVGRLLDILAAFSQPCAVTDRMAPLLLSFGRFATGL